MAKKNLASEIPDITISEAITQLTVINGNVFQLKQGTKQLIEMVESGNIEHAKKVIEIYHLKDILKNLDPKI